MKKGRIITEEEITDRRQQNTRLAPSMNCNACARSSCAGDIWGYGKPFKRQAEIQDVCPGHQEIRSAFSLIELALVHPQGLIDTELSLRNHRTGTKLRIDRYL